MSFKFDRYEDLNNEKARKFDDFLNNHCTVDTTWHIEYKIIAQDGSYELGEEQFRVRGEGVETFWCKFNNCDSSFDFPMEFQDHVLDEHKEFFDK